MVVYIGKWEGYKETGRVKTKGPKPKDHVVSFVVGRIGPLLAMKLRKAGHRVERFK